MVENVCEGSNSDCPSFFLSLHHPSLLIVLGIPRKFSFPHYGSVLLQVVTLWSWRNCSNIMTSTSVSAVSTSATSHAPLSHEHGRNWHEAAFRTTCLSCHMPPLMPHATSRSTCRLSRLLHPSNMAQNHSEAACTDTHSPHHNHKSRWKWCLTVSVFPIAPFTPICTLHNYSCIAP